MRPIRLALLLALAFSTALVGCGRKSNNENGSTTFVDQSAEGADPNSANQQREYDIQMQAPQFPTSPRPTNSSSATNPGPVLNRTELGTNIVSIKIVIDQEFPVTKHMTIKLKNQVLQFEFNSGITQSHYFNVVDSSNAFQAVGRCFNNFCSSAEFYVKPKTENDRTSVRYVRGTEYLQSDDITKLSVARKNEALLREAIEYGFPVFRHSSRIDEYKDIDLLVVERPTIDADDTTQEVAPKDVVELETSGSVTRPSQTPSADNEKPISKPAPREQRPPATGKKPPAAHQQPATPPVVGPSSTQPNRPQSASPENKNPTAPINNRARMSLSRDPFTAYQVQIPQQLFNRNTILNASTIDTTRFNILPVASQQELEPAYRIKTLAAAMVEQHTRIYQNACNIFVRSAMALAGYLKGYWFNANNFENTFMDEVDGLNRWQEFPLTSPRQVESSRIALENHLRGLPEHHAVIFQIERRNKGHIGMLTKENGQFYFYDSSHFERPPSRRQFSAEALIKGYASNATLIRVHSLPNLLPRTPGRRP